MTGRLLDLNTVVWSILLGGLTVSITLITAGLIWLLQVAGTFETLPAIAAVNLLEFVVYIVGNAGTGETGPAFLIYIGIAVLLFTPFARVLASSLYFSLIEHDWKFACITAFVLAVLSVILLFV
jgi:uncharacterized membrane protein